VQLQFTIDDAARGDAIVDALLQERLIACAQRLGPVTSRYRWHGAIEHAEEWLFVCKTVRDRVDAVVECVTALHPYDVPEIVASDVVSGLGAYLAWIEDETR
jgi:periplasmic divalent cation tolerance protein